MALKPCRECKREVSTGAKACPHCGVSHPARTVGPAHIFLGFMGLVLVIGIIGALPDSSAPTSSAETPLRVGEIPRTAAAAFAELERERRAGRLETALRYARNLVDEHAGTAEADSAGKLVPEMEKALKEAAAAAEKRRLADKWTYQAEKDPMTGKTTRSALVHSENTVEFDFPYSDPQHGKLYLRDHPSYGRDVIFAIERGQLLCPSYEDCQVRVRFDDGAPEKWNAIGPSDNSSTSLFIRNYPRFLQRLRSSRVVRIQPEVYQEGAPVFEFNVGGFDAARYNPAGSGKAVTKPMKTSTTPAPAMEWVGDPINRAAYRVSCGNGKYLIRRSREENFQVKYFRSEAALQEAGFRTVECADSPT